VQDKYVSLCLMFRFLHVCFNGKYTYKYIHTDIYIYILEHIHIDLHVFTYSLRQLEDAIISFIGFSGSLKGPGHSFH
jgi:hypothetical protein